MSTVLKVTLTKDGTAWRFLLFSQKPVFLSISFTGFSTRSYCFYLGHCLPAAKVAACGDSALRDAANATVHVVQANWRRFCRSALCCLSLHLQFAVIDVQINNKEKSCRTAEPVGVWRRRRSVVFLLQLLFVFWWSSSRLAFTICAHQEFHGHTVLRFPCEKSRADVDVIVMMELLGRRWQQLWTSALLVGFNYTPHGLGVFERTPLVTGRVLASSIRSS